MYNRSPSICFICSADGTGDPFDENLFPMSSGKDVPPVDVGPEDPDGPDCPAAEDGCEGPCWPLACDGWGGSEEPPPDCCPCWDCCGPPMSESLSLDITFESSLGPELAFELLGPLPVGTLLPCVPNRVSICSSGLFGRGVVTSNLGVTFVTSISGMIQLEHPNLGGAVWTGARVVVVVVVGGGVVRGGSVWATLRGEGGVSTEGDTISKKIGDKTYFYL